MYERRVGFTMIELLVAIVVGGVLGTAVYRTVLAQHTTNRHHTAVVASQQVTRAALDVLAAELREVSASGGDIVVAEPNRMVFRAFRRVGFVCAFDKPMKRITVFVPGQSFATEDSLLAYAQRPSADGGDLWEAMEVQNTNSVSCDGWPGVPVQRLHVPDGNLDNVEIGAPVRGFGRVTYELRQIDGEWVLARLGDGATQWQSIIGPLLPAPDGLVFRYFDAAGNTLTGGSDPSCIPIPGFPCGGIPIEPQVARIEIAAASSAPGTLGAYSDSLRTQIHLRGNAR